MGRFARYVVINYIKFHHQHLIIFSFVRWHSWAVFRVQSAFGSGNNILFHPTHLLHGLQTKRRTGKDRVRREKQTEAGLRSGIDSLFCFKARTRIRHGPSSQILL